MKNYLFILILISSLIGCSHKKPEVVEKSTDFYTCSMHPQVMNDKPGKCPICEMDLIRVTRSAALDSDEIVLTDQQMKLGNIQFDTVGTNMPVQEKALTATVVADETKINTVSARVSGRIDRLYYKNEGDQVNKGDPLLEVYSEELNNQKQQYLLLLEKQSTLGNTMVDFKQLVKSARMKLLLMGLSEGQLSQLAKTHRAGTSTTIFSTATGFISTLDVREGDYLTAGSAIVHLKDLSSLWVEAQQYASEMTGMEHNNNAVITFPDLPGVSINSKVAFTSPEIQSASRINIIRFNISNQANKIKPGMQANVSVKNEVHHSMSLPVSAVVQNKEGSSVWIMKAPNTFKNIMVRTGEASSQRVQILSGISEGQIVVTGGTYLLSSEYILKKGALPMAGMDMK